jgi:drug/metabolite transporter (DMT)-like permease
MSAEPVRPASPVIATFHERARPSLAALIAAYAAVYILWGSTYLGIRIAIETLPPFIMASARYLVAGALLYAYARRLERSPLTLRQWRDAAIVGTLMMLGGNGLVCWAEQHVASGLAALLIGTVPLWIVVLHWLVYHGPRPTRIMVVGLFVGLVGIYVLIGPQRIGGEPVYWPGAVALLAACAFWALGSLYSRRANLPKSTPLAASMEMLTGGAALLVVGLVMGEPSRVNLAAMSVRSVLALGYLIVFGSLIALTAYMWLLQVSAPAHVATYAYVNPVIAIILGALVAHEPFTPRVAVAGAIIIAAVVVITQRKPPPQACKADSQ